MNIEWPDFEELRYLAENSPDKLENLRQRQVQAIIDRAPAAYRRRLRGLQFQIDCQRKLHSTPLGSCIAISKMMHESLQRLNAAFHGEDERALARVAPADNVIPFAG